VEDLEGVITLLYQGVGKDAAWVDERGGKELVDPHIVEGCRRIYTEEKN
jgi:hypothetical protein